MRLRVTHPFDREHIVWIRTQYHDIRIANVDGDAAIILARGDTEFANGSRRVIWDGTSLARDGDHIEIAHCRYKRHRSREESKQ
jgi:hypothetical protein